MRQLLIGMITMGFAASGAFFFSFWRRTHDRLFAIFGIAFFILGIQQLLLGVLDVTNESLPLLFLIRLAAFALILGAIVDKNLRSNR